MTGDSPEKSAERPLECSGCQKAIATLYTVVDQMGVTHTVMCGSCPQLECRLRGTKTHDMTLAEGIAEQLICPGCGTSLTSLRSGAPLGCGQCYETFTDYLINELITDSKIPSPIGKVEKGTAVHKGGEPGKVSEVNLASRLQTLNQTLTEALSREDYEQAAWIRDQIKQLTEKADGGQ